MEVAYAAGLLGTMQIDVISAAKTFIESDRKRVFGFVRDLLAYLDRSGLPVVVVTGAPAEPMQ